MTSGETRICMAPHESTQLEVTVVMPCLNEADTLATCIRKALTAMRGAGIAGEGEQHERHDQLWREAVV